MDRALRDLDFVFVFRDDILVASSSPEKHEEPLRLKSQFVHTFPLRSVRRLKNSSLEVSSRTRSDLLTDLAAYLAHYVTRHRPMVQSLHAPPAIENCSAEQILA